MILLSGFFLAHLSWKLKWTLNFWLLFVWQSFVRLSIRKLFYILNEIGHKASLGEGDSRLLKWRDTPSFKWRWLGSIKTLLVFSWFLFWLLLLRWAMWPLGLLFINLLLNNSKCFYFWYSALINKDSFSCAWFYQRPWFKWNCSVFCQCLMKYFFMYLFNER